MVRLVLGGQYLEGVDAVVVVVEVVHQVHGEICCVCSGSLCVETKRVRVSFPWEKMAVDRGQLFRGFPFRLLRLPVSE